MTINFGVAMLTTVLVCAATIAAVTQLSSSRGRIVDEYGLLIEKLTPLHQPMGTSQPGDWLLTHDEPGQTFEQYVRSQPIKMGARRNTLYVQPIGQFSETEAQIVMLAAEFLGLYYACPVRVNEAFSLESIPLSARRVHPQWGDSQVLTTHVLDHVLKPQLPEDAFALIGLTTSDLWPGEGWNFVFGQASLRDRVGVWSLYRNGDPHAGPDEHKECLVRTLKTAAHETGHMLSMHHCVAFECNMCGSNNRAEADRRPLYLCPHCMAKVVWATGADPHARFRRLAEFCGRHGLDKPAEFYRRSAEILKSP